MKIANKTNNRVKEEESYPVMSKTTKKTRCKKMHIDIIIEMLKCHVRESPAQPSLVLELGGGNIDKF